MNSNPNLETLFPSISPLFAIQPSPYLSPLYGSISNLQQSSHDELNDFQLEEQPAYEIGGDLQHNSLDGSLSQILIKHQDQQPILINTLQAENPTKTQIQTPYYFPSSNKSKVYQIISFLSSNDHLPEVNLLTIGKPLYENSSQLQFVFRTLLVKFLKLKKTKQQMVKYCMRKAFKFIGDAKKQKNGKLKKQKSDKKIQTDSIFAMPFKKNCSQKTMNAQYLKQVFSNIEFLNYYKQFLYSIQQIIQEDNNSKVLYLSESIQKLLNTNNVNEVQKIKRLPWNRTILKKTSELAKTLLQFADQTTQAHLQIHENENYNQNQQNQQSD